MRVNIENNLNFEDVHNEIINESSNLPYSTPKTTWSVPLYYIWRILRYDLGVDDSYPVIAQGMMVGNPQEAEAKAILSEIESEYDSLKGYNNIRRIL